MADVHRQFTITRVDQQQWVREHDLAATEEPMEVRVEGESFAVLMRTPGADRELAAGFLFSERAILGAHEIGTVEYCVDPDDPHFKNIVNVHVLGDAVSTRLNQRRRVVTTSACGLCGRVTIESLRVDTPPIETTETLEGRVVIDLASRLRSKQRGFDRTGGLHAAGLFDLSGELETLAEDVGRHNAVDKVIGRRLFRDELPLTTSLLFVSGRASFEIVQKALLAGIPFVCAVSAPTSLAVELAEQTGITLLGFVRGETFNIYSHPERVH